MQHFLLPVVLAILNCSSVFAQSLDSTSAVGSSEPRVVDGAAEVATRFPSGSITTTSSADDALRDIKRERALIETQHSKSGQVCATKFFTNNCLDKALESRRASLARLRVVEIEANAFIRHAKAEADDQDIAVKQQKFQDRSPIEPLPENSAVEAISTVSDSNKYAGSPRVPRSPQAPHVQHGAKPNKASQLKDNVKTVAKQAHNEAAYDKKIADSLKRQDAVRERKAASEQKRLKKQAAEAKTVTPFVP